MRTPSTTVDGFGRVVIPKAARDRHGLHAGTVLELLDSPDGLLIRPASTDPPVSWKADVLVLTSQAEGSLDDVVRADRSARTKRLGLGSRR